MADTKRRESTAEEKKRPERAHPKARTAAIIIALVIYVITTAVIFHFVMISSPGPFTLPTIFSLIAILIALVPITVQLYGFIRKAPGAAWQIMFIRHSSKTIPTSSREYDAQYEFVVENRGSTYGVLKKIELDFFGDVRFKNWDFENSIKCYLNIPESPLIRLSSLPIPPQSARYIYISLRVKEEQGKFFLESKTKPGVESERPIDLETIGDALFRFTFVFTKEAFQLRKHEQKLNSPIFRIGDDSFQKPK